MAGVAGNAFRQAALKAALNHTAQGANQYMILFKNNYTPLEDDVLADYTKADFTGYADINLTGSSWSVTSAAPAVASYAEQTFLSSADQAAQTIYGYAIFITGTNVFVGAERFAAAQVIQNNLDEIKVTPRLRLYTKA